MTMIKSLSMKGFKSFAHKIDVPMGTGFNMFIGPNGAGKCLTYDTEIQLADGSLQKIGDLVEQKLQTNPSQKIDDGYIIGGDQTSVLTLDTKDLTLKKTPIAAYVKRTSPEHLIKIRTRSGREVIATPYHPLFTLEGNFIKSVNADQLREGLTIAVPRALPIKPVTTQFTELLDLIITKDNIYVPYSPVYQFYLIRIKHKRTWKSVASTLDIPLHAIKGLLNKQAINFTYIRSILRANHLTNQKIISLIPRVKSKTQKKTCRIPWNNSKELSLVLGYLLAEGRFPPDSDQIWFVNGTPPIVQEYAAAFANVFDERVTINEYKPHSYDVLAYSHPIRVFLEKLGMGVDGTINKTITPLYLSHSAEEHLAALLNGLYSGDGYVSDHTIEITTKSPTLARRIETILLRFGIFPRSTSKIKIATNSGFSGLYHILTLSELTNLQRFHSRITLTHPDKQTKLSSIIHKKSNPNLDLIDASLLIKQVVRDLHLNTKKIRKQYPTLESYIYAQCTPSRPGVQHLIQHVFSSHPLASTSQSLSVLHLLAYSDIYWDTIADFETIPASRPYVYDLTIAEHHNFVANNFIVHNSNVCDALCFVLGKSSAKEMRAEKSSNLIYNGGKKGKPASEAEVTLILDNKDRKLPVQEDEVKLSRMVKPNGTSVYKINGEPHTRQQVRDVLAAGRIDPDGHNIVLQGDIINFMSMKPVERRMIIEQIAGISAYEEKKQKCLLELTKVDTKLNEAEIILKERETNLRELKKDRDQAVRFRELESTIKNDKATYVHLRMKDKETVVNEIDTRKKEAESKITKVQADILACKEKIGKIKEEINGLTKELEQKGERDQLILRKEIEALKEASIKAATRLEVVRAELEKIKSRKTSLHQDSQSIVAKMQDITVQKKNYEQKIKTLTQEKSGIETRISQFKEKHGFDGDLTKGLESLEKEAETVQQQVQQLQEHKQELVRKIDQYAFKLQACDERISSLRGTSDNEDVETLKKKRTLLKEISGKLTLSVNEDSSLAVQLSNARKESIDLSNQLAKLQGRQLSINERNFADLALRKLLDKKNAIKGILGTVAQLGKVDAAYSLALEVAAGGRLQSIVVDSDGTAQRCIEFLKEQKIGVATFLPLNKVKARQTDERIKDILKEKGVHGLATDLVSYDKKLGHVFSYVLGSTVIVDALETARRIGIGRSRMVTLGGELLEPSGAMIGGFRARTGIGFEEKGVSDEVEHLETELSSAHTLIDHLEKKRVSNEEQLRGYRQQRAEVEVDILKLEKTLQVEGTDLDLLEQERKTLTGDMATLGKKLQEFDNDLKKEYATLEGLKTKRIQLHEKISNPEIAHTIESYETAKMKMQEALHETQAALKGLEIQLTSILQPEVEKAEKIIKQQEKEHETFLHEEQELSELLKKRDQDLKVKENDEKKFFSNLRDLSLKRSKLSEKIQEHETEQARDQEKQHSFEQKLNSITIERAKAVAELEGLQHEFSQYQDVKLVRGVGIDELKVRVAETERELAKIGNVNLRALEVYDDIQKEHKTLVEKADKLKLEKDDVLKIMQEVESKKAEVFMKTYNVIVKNFKTIFSNLTSKGEIHVSLENPENPFEGGMEIQVKIANNKSMDMKSLSGGEKTMAALAFIFAIQEYEPSPFYLLDEVDAALDKRNASLLSKLIQQYASKAQYIVVSHNDSVITEAEQIYGVSMQEGISKILSLKI